MPYRDGWRRLKFTRSMDEIHPLAYEADKQLIRLYFACIFNKYSFILKLLTYLCSVEQLDLLKRELRPGAVYRRADLQQWSKSVDRHLQELVKDGTLEKVSGGLYYVPAQSTFGKLPAEEHALIEAFLKDSHFLVTSPSDYNALGVGTSQLYNTRFVYNHKRHGEFKLGNRSFQFIRKPYIPNKLTSEFLLVDLVNNLEKLAEDQSAVLDKVKERAGTMNQASLRKMANKFGKVRTRKLFNTLLAN
jgi:hypothetical protein